MSYSWENWWTDTPKKQFIPLIPSSDIAIFTVQRLIEKSCNLIGQEHGPYLTYQFSQIWNLFKHTTITVSQTFIIYQTEKKNKELRKKLNFPIHLKILRLGLFSPFLGKALFLKHLALSCTTPQGPLTRCWVPEKTKELIPRKRSNRWTNRPYTYDPSGHDQGSYKKIRQLRGIAVDDKIKSQYNSP